MGWVKIKTEKNNIVLYWILAIFGGSIESEKVEGASRKTTMRKKNTQARLEI